MKKRLFRISFLIVTIAVFFNLIACDRSCFVYFETNGGSVLEPYRRLNGVYFDTLDNVPITTKNGYRFDGWYYDAEFKKIVEFPFSSGWNDYTFFAKWQESLLVDYEIIYESSSYERPLFGNENGENLFVIHSVDQLEFLVDSGQIGEPIEISSIFSQNLLDYYNENYFESEVLVLASYMFSSGPCENELGNLRKEGKFLTLDLIKINQGENTALWWWNFMLEIDKSHFVLDDDPSSVDVYAQFSVNWMDTPSSSEISDFNNNFDGEFKLAESMPSKSDIHNVNYDDFRLEMGFGCYLFYSDDDLTHYIIGGFPDCLDDYAVISFFTTNPKYEIFGFSIGSSPNEAGNTLTQRGYTLCEEESTTGSAVYILDKIRISFSCDCDGGIGGILISGPDLRFQI